MICEVDSYRGDRLFPVRDFPLAVISSLQSRMVALHDHDFFELVFIAGGYARHRVAGEDGGERWYGLIQGDVFLVMPGERHGYDEGCNLTIYNVCFRRTLLAEDERQLAELPSYDVLFGRRSVRGKIHLTLNDRRAGERCLKKLHRELVLRRPGFRLAARAALLEFLLIAGRTSASELSGAPAAGHGILATIRSMESAPEKPLTLAGLARQAGMSVPYYTRKFREVTGVAPIAYLIGLRLEKARGMLEESARSVAEIAPACGFCDSNYLIRLFGVRYGMTPARYRAGCSPSPK